MEVIMVDVERIVPYARNPRRNDDAVDAVAASIKEFGFRQPIVVDEDYVVIVGHTRLKAAKKLGLQQVPVHIARGLSDAQKRAYRIADNRLSQIAEWDYELLGCELHDLQIDGYDIDRLMLDPRDIELALKDYSGVEPSTADEQGRLDERTPIVCPSCGYQWYADR